jgi:glycosyltransferase involved in cell wall biosynthesis
MTIADQRLPIFCLVDPSLKDFIGHHYEYDRAVVEGAEDGGYEVVCLAHRDVIPDVVAQLPLRPAFMCDIWAAPEGVDRSNVAAVEQAANDQFYDDLKAATADIKLDGEAIVFGHMVTSRQLLGWARFVEEHAGENGPTVVLLLRYQPEHYMGPLAEKAFAMLQTAARGGKLRLSSDSSRLADQLQRLTTLPIETWPLPHTTELGGKALRRRKKKTLRVVSLGNARDEKGILELLNSVRILEAMGQAARFEFVFQVNDANPDVAAPIAAFAAERHPQTKLLTESLSTEDYFELLKSADVVALPYWRDIYVARTSGVFLEAVAAGKPVICTFDTWMSDQLALAGAGILVKDRDETDLAVALVEMADRYEELYKTAQETRGRWLELHNPNSFMRALLHGETAPAAALTRPSVAVLYPWGDALSGAAGAALRLNLFLRFLSERSGRVRLLEEGGHGDIVRDGVRYEAMPFQHFMHGHWSYRWITRISRRLLGAKNGEEIYFGLMLLPRFSKVFYRRVNELVKNSDIIFLEYPFWAPLVARACQAHGKRFVLTTYDVISDQIRGSAVLRWLTLQLERRAMKSADMCSAVTATDQARFRSWGIESILSPNCVDAEAVAQRLPAPTRDLLLRLCGLPPDTRHLFIFVGSKFHPNVLAAEEARRIAEVLQAQHGDLKAQVVVAGACMEPRREPGFAALGRVDDVTLKLLYEHCTAVLIPLTLGTGLSLKTVEALAAGQVIVGTDIAFRGIPSRDEPGWIVENDFTRYPDVLARVATNADYARAIAAKGVEYGRELDFRNTFAPYLDLEPRLADSPPVLTHASEKYKTYVLDAARAARQVGHIETARLLLDRLIESHPTTGEAYRLRADLRTAEGDDDAEAALADLDEALRCKVSAPAVLRSKAVVLNRMGRAAEASATLDAAARITVHMIWTPASELALRASLWEALHAGDRDWLQRVTRAAIAAKGETLPSDYTYLFAHSALGQGADLDMALRSAHRALETGYDRFWGLMLVGEIQQRLGDVDGALDSFRAAAAATSAPELKATASNHAATELWPLFDAGRYEDLLRKTEALLAEWPDHAAGNYIRAECMKIVGHDLLAACGHYKAAIGAGFRPYYGHLSLGQLQGALGESPSGLQSLINANTDAQTEGERDNVRQAIIDLAPQAISSVGAPWVAGQLRRLPPETLDVVLRRLADSPSEGVIEHVNALWRAGLQPPERVLTA